MELKHHNSSFRQASIQTRWNCGRMFLSPASSPAR